MKPTGSVARSAARRLHRSRAVLAVLMLAGGALSASGVGCAPEPKVVLAPTEAKAGSPDRGFPKDERGLMRVRSPRLHLSLALPDGRAWRVDDKSHPELVAKHAPTSSTLTVAVVLSRALMNRHTCEEATRDAGLLALRPDAPELRTIEDSVALTAEGYDARVWVALQPPTKPGAPLTGHVFEFGASARRCVFFHFESEVSSDGLEEVLSDRLATARLRILGSLVLEPFDDVGRETLRPSR